MTDNDKPTPSELEAAMIRALRAVQEPPVPPVRRAPPPRSAELNEAMAALSAATAEEMADGSLAWGYHAENERTAEWVPGGNWRSTNPMTDATDESLSDLERAKAAMRAMRRVD